MSRSIFEEVSAETPSGAEPPRSGEAQREAGRRQVRIWILILAVLVVIQIAIGGLTRITDSGLSITDWSVMGSLPPLSDEAWSQAFEAYKKTTEYQEINGPKGMTLEQFKPIFWWEWSHRMWGRLIGIVFLIPFIWFLIKRRIPSGWLAPIVVAGALGALQGVIGWWMVESGLVGRTDVSQHRLAVHKGLAYIILGVLFWIMFSLKRSDVDLLQARRRREPGMLLFSRLLMAGLAVQIVMGAYVAGLNGGGVYGDWPLMGGALYPPNEPFQPFENPAASQFMHRTLAYALFIAALFYFLRARRSAYQKTQKWGVLVFGLMTLQMLFGVLTVMTGVQSHTAFTHHFTAILLFVGVLHALHQSSYPAEEKISA